MLGETFFTNCSTDFPVLPQPSSAAAVGRLAACKSVTFRFPVSTAAAALPRRVLHSRSNTSWSLFVPHRSASALFR